MVLVRGRPRLFRPVQLKSKESYSITSISPRRFVSAVVLRKEAFVPFSWVHLYSVIVTFYT